MVTARSVAATATPFKREPCHAAVHFLTEAAVLLQIKDLGVKAGVVLNPATPLSTIQYVISQVDLILLMSGES